MLCCVLHTYEDSQTVVFIFLHVCLFAVFYTEVLESIRHGVADLVDPENIILEINASK